MKRTQFVTCLFAIILSSVGAFAQWIERPLTGSPQQTFADRTSVSNLSGVGPQLETHLVEPRSNAKQKRAVVEVEVWGVDLITPDSNREPSNNEAYLLYRLDNQQIVRSADKEYTFDNISPGNHAISVQLAMSNGNPIGTRMVMSIHIPK